jgi:phosphohistidine phosphatase
MPDLDRPLSETGLREARDVAAQALALGWKPDLLLCSPARRCRQTADMFAESLGTAPVSIDNSLYAGGSEAYLAAIEESARQGSVMLVGHNPVMEVLAQELSISGAWLGTIADGYPTAGLLALDLPASTRSNFLHAGEVVAFLKPSFA